MQNEGRKIMHLPELRVNCTCVRVPVMRSHSESITVEFKKPLSPERARQILEAAPGVKVVDDPANSVYPMPLDTSDQDLVYVGRIREDLSAPDEMCIRDSSGSIEFKGQSIVGVKSHKVVERGMALCPEGRRVFSQMSVSENLDMGGYTRSDAENRETLQRVYERFPRLKERMGQMAGTLSGGEQQMLAMGRALMSKPDLLMLCLLYTSRCV